jgi:hypothetical protein
MLRPDAMPLSPEKGIGIAFVGSTHDLYKSYANRSKAAERSGGQGGPKGTTSSRREASWTAVSTAASSTQGDGTGLASG